MATMVFDCLCSQKVTTMLLVLVAVEITVSVGFMKPIEDCRTSDIDLVLVADADRPSSSMYNSIYFEHIYFFSKFIDNFLGPEETFLTRLQVSILVAGEDEPQLLVSFNDFNTTESLKKHILLELSELNTYGPTSPAKSLLFAKDLFEESHGARINANHIIVLFLDYRNGGLSSLNEVEKLQKEKLNNTSNATVYVVAVRFPSYSGEIPELKNTVHVTSLWNDDDVNIISMAFCQSCAPGWFTFINPRTHQESSCYMLIGGSSQTDWYGAWEICQLIGDGVILAVVETKEELEFLKTTLSELLLSENKQRLNVTSSQIDIKLYIGLIRELTSKGRRFLWTTGQPLIVTNWASGQPNGGRLQGCGVWRFIFNSARNVNTSESEIFFNVTLDSDSEGWLDIGCWNYITHLTLCESKIPITSKKAVKFPSVQPANKFSFNKALESGDFIQNLGIIRAMSAGLEEADKRKKKKKKTFDCVDDAFESKSILYSSVCDYIDDCPNGRDENICYYKLPFSCSEFLCKSSQCVPNEFVCDLTMDCKDLSDEENCEHCKGHRCSDGNCLPKHWLFDGEADCHGNSICSEGQFHDESLAVNCINNNVLETHEHCVFICNRTQCVYPSQLNDGFVDCQGPEGPLDETIGKLEAGVSCYNALNNVIWAPRCVYIKDQYQSVLGCRDMSHLKDCEDFECVEGYVKCPDSYCIPLHFLGNGHFDCPNGEDEAVSWARNCTGNFQCWTKYVNPNCLHPDLVCDGYSHCPYGDDELNCHTSCPEGLQCLGGAVTVTKPNRSLKLSDLDSRIRYLDLSGVDLELSLPFAKGLNNLIEVHLSDCKIISLESLGDIFDDWKTVYWMDLSYNLMKNIDIGIFHSMSNVHMLNLSHNFILKAVQNTLVNFESLLEVLDLSYTAIVTLPREVLTFCGNLKHLNLSHTKISRFHTGIFPNNFRLYSLDLRGSPIQSFSPNPFNSLTIVSSMYTDKYGLCCEQIRGPGIPGHKCHAPEDAISSCYNLMAGPVRRVLLWLIGITSLLGNLVVIVYRCVWEKGILKKAYGLFVINLGVADFIMGVYLLIIAWADVHYTDNFVWNEDYWRHSATCTASGFLSTFSSETSTFFILLITLDRYLVIRYPFGRFRFTRLGMVTATIMAWCVGFLLALIPAMPGLKKWTIYSSNAMCLGLPLNNDYTEGWAYSTAIFVVFNFVLFLAIAFGQYAIYRSMASHRLAQARGSRGDSVRRAQDIEVAKQLSLVVVSDFLCWFPIGVMGFLVMAGQDIGNDAYGWTAVLILPINSAVNPILYTIPRLLQKWKEFKYGPSSVQNSNANNNHVKHVEPSSCTRSPEETHDVAETNERPITTNDILYECLTTVGDEEFLRAKLRFIEDPRCARDKLKTLLSLMGEKFD